MKSTRTGSKRNVEIRQHQDESMKGKKKPCAEEQFLPCYCKKCNGSLVSRQTMYRHIDAVNSAISKEVTCDNHTSLSDSMSREMQSITETDRYQSCYAGCSFDLQEVSKDGSPFLNSISLNDSHNSYDAAVINDFAESDVETDDHCNNECAAVDDEDGDEDSDEDEDDDDDDGVDDGVDDGDNDGDGDDADRVITDRMEKFILRTLQAKVKFGWSREEALQQLQNFYEYERSDCIPHTSWNKVMEFLRGIGYKDPHAFKVCFSSNHVELLNDQSKECPTCKKPRKDCVDYYVLGLNLEDMFCSEDYTRKIMAHWENKDDWFHVGNQTYPKKEIWHGHRFQELSYFWDEHMETLIPGKCENCMESIPKDEILKEREKEGIVNERQPFRIKCMECQHVSVFTPTFMKGCPLNQVFIFHEDGFNSFTKKTRGIATIQISSACTYKESRGVSFQVYSFIPTCYINDGIVHKMDAFFKPLFDEIDSLYRHGTAITLSSHLQLKGCVIPRGQYQVRALLLLGTADLKSHQEIALYAGGGRCGCRKCLLIGVYIAAKRHYYYGGFRERFRTGIEPRTAEYVYKHGKRCEEARTNKERQTIQRETGVKGVSILFKLYKLYGFDPIEDMVIDRMHVCFNMLKREFTDNIWKDLGPNADEVVNDRDPSVGGLIDRAEFANALSSVNWTTEQKASGAARLKSFTDQLGGWKTAEYNKFSQVAREVLAGRISSKAYDCFMLLCQANNMLYSKELRYSGWTEENVSRLNDLLWSHAIHFEEYYGIESCTENLEYSTHIADDIRRHSSPDNYTCELYERGIRIHKQQKHNSKSIEKTLTLREGLRQFIRVYERKNGPLSELKMRPEYKFNECILDEDQPFFLHESSLEAAKLVVVKFRDTTNNCMIQALSNGVCLGKMKTKPIDNEMVREIKQHLQPLHPYMNINVPHRCKYFNAIVKENNCGEIVRFKVGDVCVLAGGPNLDEEWVIELSSFIQVGPIGGHYYNFADGEYYIPAYDNKRKAVVHPWTKTNQLVHRHYTRGKIQPTCNIKRRCILYPDPADLENPTYFLPIDFEKPEGTIPIAVPVFLKQGDDVKIQGTRNETWYGKVTEVDISHKSAKVNWYTPTMRAGVWNLDKKIDRISFSSVLALAEFQRVSGGPRKYKLI